MSDGQTPRRPGFLLLSCSYRHSSTDEMGGFLMSFSQLRRQCFQVCYVQPERHAHDLEFEYTLTVPLTVHSNVLCLNRSPHVSTPSRHHTKWIRLFLGYCGGRNTIAQIKSRPLSSSRAWRYVDTSRRPRTRVSLLYPTLHLITYSSIMLVACISMLREDWSLVDWIVPRLAAAWEVELCQASFVMHCCSTQVTF